MCVCVICVHMFSCVGDACSGDPVCAHACVCARMHVSVCGVCTCGVCVHVYVYVTAQGWYWVNSPIFLHFNYKSRVFP